MWTLLDSQYYSILYYNAVVWLTVNIGAQLKHDLLAASAKALRSCVLNVNFDASYENIHLQAKKCTPKQITLYLQSLQLHKMITDLFDSCTKEHALFLDKIVCTRRQILFQMIGTNRYKIGCNTATNKLFPLNGLIGLDRLKLKFVHFKKIMKIQFLKNGKT